MIQEKDVDVTPVRVINYDYIYDDSPAGKARLNFEAGVTVFLIVMFIIGSILY